MAGISANENRKLAMRVVELYNSAENHIFEKMTNRLSSGVADPLWEQKKLKQIKLMRKDVLEQIAILDKNMPPEVQKIISEGYMAGVKSVDIEANVKIAFGKIDKKKVEALAKALEGTLEDTHPQIIRAADDVYRQVITEAATQTITGTATQDKAVQLALNRFAMKGITGFKDKLNRNWNLGAYSDMACRSNLVQANLSGTITRMDELGIDLVVVSEHPGSSNLCLPWEGKILEK